VVVEISTRRINGDSAGYLISVLKRDNATLKKSIGACWKQVDQLRKELKKTRIKNVLINKAPSPRIVRKIDRSLITAITQPDFKRRTTRLTYMSDHLKKSTGYDFENVENNAACAYFTGRKLREWLLYHALLHKNQFYHCFSYAQNKDGAVWLMKVGVRWDTKRGTLFTAYRFVRPVKSYWIKTAPVGGDPYIRYYVGVDRNFLDDFGFTTQEVFKASKYVFPGGEQQRVDLVRRIEEFYLDNPRTPFITRYDIMNHQRKIIPTLLQVRREQTGLYYYRFFPVNF